MRYRLHMAPRHGIALELVCLDCPVPTAIRAYRSSEIDLDDVAGAAADHTLRRHLRGDVARELRNIRNRPKDTPT